MPDQTLPIETMMADPTTEPPNPAPEDKPMPASQPPTLTEEEQMALFEAALKETDWGHQPC